MPDPIDLQNFASQISGSRGNAPDELDEVNEVAHQMYMQSSNPNIRSKLLAVLMTAEKEKMTAQKKAQKGSV